MALFYQPSKATEIVLTTLFGLEVAAIFAALLQGRLAAGCPVSSLMAAAALAGCCLLVAPMIKLVKLVSGVVGASVSRTLLAKDPLGKFRTRTKYEDQCWQLWIHATMTALEVYTIFYDGGGEPWMREYKSFWVPHAREQVHTKASLHALYLVQTAIWIATCFSHQFLEQRHKDYVMMYLHHLVTIALLLLSYTWGYLRIGAMVLLWHDSSDIVIDLLKITNYMKLEGPRHLFLVELCFITNLFTWGYARLYLYGYQVVFVGGLIAPREMYLSPGSPNIGWWVFNSLMVALIVMHVIWYLMFWRMLFRLIGGETGHEAGKEEYEGDSDDE